ncbi:hypothetical protein [Natrarchaeobaculum aegyptiacum]|nr:hypothetical protein [Natrarchaeobaculum aegyptiacum]
MIAPDFRHPETALEVFLVGGLEFAVVVANYLLNGPGPAPVVVTGLILALTAWIVWADYRIISRDGLYPLVHGTRTYSPDTDRNGD